MMLNHADFCIDDSEYIRDDVDLESAKVNAALLCYAVLSFEDGITHLTTRKTFTGNNPDIFETYSPILSVDSTTAPCFLWCHMNDGTVNSLNTLRMAEALERKAIPYESHLYDDDGFSQHGVGCAKQCEEAKEWPSLATEFLKNLGF